MSNLLRPPVGSGGAGGAGGGGGNSLQSRLFSQTSGLKPGVSVQQIMTTQGGWSGDTSFDIEFNKVKSMIRLIHIACG